MLICSFVSAANLSVDSHATSYCPCEWARCDGMTGRRDDVRMYDMIHNDSHRRRGRFVVDGSTAAIESYANCTMHFLQRRQVPGLRRQQRLDLTTVRIEPETK